MFAYNSGWIILTVAILVAVRETYVFLKKSKDSKRRGIFDNVIRGIALKTNMTDAFNEIDTILKHHAGPYASNAVIGSRWRQQNDVDEFTKDGIKILMHLIVSEDPIARFVARMVRFIGISVDRRCFDGTTTSMLLFARLGKLAIEHLDKPVDKNEAYCHATYIKDILNECLEYVDELRITDEDIFQAAKDFGIETTIHDVRAAMAYHMSMISSKGDDDLSSKIATVIRSAPKNLLGMLRDMRTSIESEERYILKKQEYDLSVNANIGNHNNLNYKSGTQFYTDKAVIFSTGNEIINDSWEALFLQALISKNPKHRKEAEPYFGPMDGWDVMSEKIYTLVIISPMLHDSSLMIAIDEFNRHHPECKIVFFNTQTVPRMRMHLNKTMHYLAGTPTFQDAQKGSPLSSLIGLTGEKAIVHLMGHNLSIGNLYQKTGEVLHPYFNDPEAFPDYTKYRLETEETIEFGEKNATNVGLDIDELTYLTSLYRSLTCQEIFDIQIGGSIHDQYSNTTVYQDAIGASLSAVKEGVVMGGYYHLSSWFSDSPLWGELGDAFGRTFLSIMSDSLRASPETIDELGSEISSKWDYMAITHDDSGEGGGEPEVYHFYERESIAAFLNCDPSDTYLLQAYGGYNEQFKRFRDILGRLAVSTHLIDMRTNNDNDYN